MSEYVLDASAILTVLNSEKGMEVVRPLLSRSVVSVVNLAEVVARLAAVGMPEDGQISNFELSAAEGR